MAMGLLGYAVAGAGEGLGQGMVSVGFEAMKQAMEQNRQAALLQMREEMDIAKEKRGQDIKIADETRHEATAKRLRETDVGLINPFRCWINVDFPEPVCPITAMNSSFFISKFISFNA